jgi:cell wall-associated NlpC family hydrolase
MSIRDEIIAEARTYLNTPFVHQGRVKGVGIDCAGMMRLPAIFVGIEIEDVPAYSRSSHSVLKPLIEKYCVKVIDPKPTDIYLFYYIHNQPQHMAWVTDKGMLHACVKSKKVIEHVFDSRWKKRLEGCYRLRALADE